MQSLVHLCHELANAGSLEVMFAAVVDALAEGTGLQRTSVLTTDPTGAMRFRASRGLSATYRERVDGHSPWPTDCSNPQEILVDDVTLHPVTRDLAAVFAREDIAALAFLPLVAGGRLLGKFMLYAGEVTDWSRVELPFARAVADLMATFLLREDTQQRLLQARKMESLGFLAGGIAHDFNNLLTAILGYADIVRTDATTPPTTREHAERQLDVIAQATELTRQLLDFARPKPLHVEAVDVAALVAESRPGLTKLAGERIHLAVVVSGRSLPVAANRAQMLQVLRNLVANARDAMPDGGTLTISAQERADRHGKSVVELAVTDDGVGMDDKVRARIFEPLFTTKRQGRGTGLGLAICYGVVSHLGGEITVTSSLGRGSTFVVTLPLAATALLDLAPPTRPMGGSGTTVSVLLVDDQTAVRHAIATGITKHGCIVTDVASGREAIAALQQRRFDVVVSDVVMPEMDGIELVGRIREMAPDLPVLLITGYAEIASDLPPHVPVLQKPFTPTELARRIGDLVRQT